MSSHNETHLIRRGIVAIGLLAIAAVHLFDLPGKWTEVRYLGIGYVGIIIVSLVLAERVITSPKRNDYVASAGLALAVIIGFVINRTIGMPGAMDDIGNWTEALGLASLFVEGLVLQQALTLAAKFHTVDQPSASAVERQTVNA